MINITASTLDIRSIATANLTPASWDNEGQAVGSVIEMRAVFTTDKTSVQDADIYVLIGLWCLPGYVGEPAGQPIQPYLYHKSLTTLTLGLAYGLTFTGNANQWNYNFEITHDIIGGFWTMTVQGTAVLLEDNIGYSTTTNNNRRYFYTSRTATAPLTNIANSNYLNSPPFEYRVFMSILEDGLNGAVSTNWGKKRTSLAQATFWWNSLELGLPLTGKIDNFQFIFERPDNFTVGNLSNTINTKVKIRFDNTAGLNVLGYWAIIRVDSNNNSISVFDNAKIDIGTGSQPISGNNLSNGFMPTWLNAVGNNGTLVGVANDIALISGLTYGADFYIKASELVDGAAYRIYAVLYWETTTPGLWSSYSFLSDALVVNALPDTCAPTVLDNGISDYYNNYGDCLTVTPRERLRARLRFDGGVYNSCRLAQNLGHNFVHDLQKITVETYSIDGVYTHYYTRDIIQKNGIGLWPASPLFYLDLTVLNEIGISYYFRVRYEANEQNLQTTDANGTNLGSLSNQDWTDKTVYIKFTLQLNHTTPVVFSDYVYYTFRINVHKYDKDCITLQAVTINDLPLMNLCDFDTNFKVSIDSCKGSPDNVIGLIDRIPLSRNRIKEADGSGSPANGGLEYLFDSPFVSLTDNLSVITLTQATGEMVFDATAIELGEEYNVCAVLKGSCQQDGTSGGPGTTQTLHKIGNYPGIVRVLCNAFGVADEFQLWYNALMQSTTGNIAFTSLLEYNYLAIDGEPDEIQMDVIGVGVFDPCTSTLLTGWDYAVFCVDSLLPCGTILTETRDKQQVIGVPGFSRTTFGIFFCGDSAGNVVLRFRRNPSAFDGGGYDLPNFRIEVWYNNIKIIDATIASSFSPLPSPPPVFVDINTGTTGGYITGAVLGDDYNFILTNYDPSINPNYISVSVMTDNITTGLFTVTCPSGYPPRPYEIETLCTVSIEPTIDFQIDRVNIIYPEPTYCQNNSSVTKCITLPVKRKCGSIYLDDPCCGYNPTRCAQDLEYYQPVCVACDDTVVNNCGVGCQETDILYFQFHFPDYFNNWGISPPTHGWTDREQGDWLACVRVHSPFDCELGLADYAESYFVGIISTGQSFQQIAINPEKLPPIFYFSFSFNLNGQIITVYTEPYRKVSCEHTVLLEGTYKDIGKGAYDCDGQYYGLPTNYYGNASFTYKKRTRVKGSFNPIGFSIERTETNRITTRTKKMEKFKLFTDMLPYYVIKELQTIFMGQTLYIDGKIMTFTGEVNKKNPKGNMWVVEMDLMDSDPNKCYISEFECD